MRQKLVVVVLVQAISLGGCVRMFGGNSTDVGLVDHGTSSDSSSDTSRDSDIVADAATSDAATSDFFTSDFLTSDVIKPDLVTPPCVAQADANTVALYTFEGSGSTVADLTGMHPGMMIGSNVSRGNGKPGCGLALQNSGSSAPVSYATIPPSTDFQLATGSVDFWVRADPTLSATGPTGLVTRDAFGTQSEGHLSIVWTDQDEIALRLQTQKGAYGRCSPPMKKGTWHHVKVNFGGGKDLELVVTTGGVTSLIGPRASIVRGGLTIPCSGTTAEGINGNNLCWVFGANTWLCKQGKLDKVDLPFKGLIDSVRISKIRR